ncbi:hypothetical protein C8Q72DRAFT_890022 [Fomitopsis betulina]|nr:hypothetical protein C8Q72DRAFT_890022 [Fomitopsis betulina]
MEGAKEGDLTDTVIEISEHLRQPHRASTSLSREGTSSLGTSTLLNESSERSTIPRSGASVSTASVYSQDMSLPSDSSAAAIGLTTAADLCGSAYCPEERSLQTPAPVLLRPESLVKPLREDHSCASTLFQDAKPIPVFELAAADARPGGLASSRSSWSSSSGAALSDVSRTTESSLPTYIPLSIKPPTQSAVLRKFSAFSLTGPPMVELGFGRRGTSYL